MVAVSPVRDDPVAMHLPIDQIEPSGNGLSSFENNYESILLDFKSLKTSKASNGRKLPYEKYSAGDAP